MKSPQTSRLVGAQTVPPHMAQHGHNGVLPGTLPAATHPATRESVDPLGATQVLSVPSVPNPAVYAAPLPNPAEMPLWVLLLVLTALTIPLLAALRLVVPALCRLANRWPFFKVLGAVLLLALAGMASYWLTRRFIRTDLETVPQSVPLLWPSSSRATSGTPKPVTEPSAPFPATREGRAAFVRTMVSVLRHKGLTRRQALLFAAHLARETGWGRWVRGNNFGNIKAGSGWTGPVFTLTDARGFTAQYRAWPTLEQGIQSTLALVRDSARYRKAWRLLRAGDPRWYGQLGLDGYYEGPTGHARDGSRFHTEHDLATVQAVQREYEGIVALATQYDGGNA